MASTSQLRISGGGGGGSGSAVNRASSFKRTKEKDGEGSSKSKKEANRGRRDGGRKGGGGGGDDGGPTGHWATARAKMDVSKALAIMGFSSSRKLDGDAQTELNMALSRQMEKIENPDYKGRQRRGGGKGKRGVTAGPPISIEEQQRNDVRMLHEAYQFLMHKFITPASVSSSSSSAAAATTSTDKKEQRHDPTVP